MVIIAWVLFYLWTSFFPSLIWGNCDNDWNSLSNFYFCQLEHEIMTHLLTDCFSIVQDIACQKNNVGNPSDQIFYQRACRQIGEICSLTPGLVGVNANFCFNQATGQQVPINEVITRTLAAEEFY